MNDHRSEPKALDMPPMPLSGAPMGHLRRRDALFAGAASFALGSLGLSTPHYPGTRTKSSGDSTKLSSRPRDAARSLCARPIFRRRPK